MIKGENFPTPKTISLDAQKAFIKSMQPKYNKEMYATYPKSKDGLFSHYYDGYSFQIHSPIILCYDQGEIVGNSHHHESDSIVVRKGQPLRIVKYNK